MNKVQIWSRLAKRAEAQASNALAEVADVRRQLQKLAASEARLLELRADYAARLQKVESASHAMSQNMASVYRKKDDPGTVSASRAKAAPTTPWSR